MVSEKSILISWIFIAFTYISIAQQIAATDDFDSDPRGENGLRIMFYNVENLFDTFDDPAVNDDEFAPGKEKNWTDYRYDQKLNNIAKTIIALGGWEPPDIIGLCETENFQVILDLTVQTPLRNYGYRIIHENSADQRGIDNALLYLPEKLDRISHETIDITTGENSSSRDILYVQFAFQKKDTIHVYVNHWPSRYGGKEATADKRKLAARRLRSAIDTLMTGDLDAKVFIMGDFNDEPGDLAIHDFLGVQSIQDEISPVQLYNLSYADYRSGKGTLVYKEIDNEWYLFDQMIVSGNLLRGRGLLTVGTKNHIFITDWLLKNDKPGRTYQGPIYLGGFSDHLPIFIDLYYKD